MESRWPGTRAHPRDTGLWSAGLHRASPGILMTWDVLPLSARVCAAVGHVFMCTGVCAYVCVSVFCTRTDPGPTGLAWKLAPEIRWTRLMSSQGSSAPRGQ